MGNVSNTRNESDARDILELEPVGQTDGARAGPQFTTATDDVQVVGRHRSPSEHSECTGWRVADKAKMPFDLGGFHDLCLALCAFSDAHTWKFAGRDPARGEAFRGTTEWRRSSNRHAEQLQDIMASGAQ